MAIKRWSSKHIVVAAAIGTVVVVAIAVVIMISLTPPQLQFSILDASQGTDASHGKFYNFTLSANNTSPRMEVHYTSLNTEIWISPNLWYTADMNMKVFRPGNVQSPQNVTKVPGWAENYGLENKTQSLQDARGAVNWPNYTVVVTAKVLFKVGLARTRPYLIRVSCFPVDFFYGNKTPYTDCTY